MSDAPQLALSGIVLDAPDAATLASFYRRLLGWEVEQDEPGWVTLRAPSGGPCLSFQSDKSYVRPVWPAGPDDQQMMVHLDIRVDDLDAASTHATRAGATLAEHQPQVRVHLDPDGHPFCLFLEDA